MHVLIVLAQFLPYSANNFSFLANYLLKITYFEISEFIFLVRRPKIMQKSLTLERLWGFSEGTKYMGGHFDPTLKKRV